MEAIMDEDIEGGKNVPSFGVSHKLLGDSRLI